MLEVFWLNVFLLALATGERLRSRGGLLALVGAATLAPLWDFGFEIRPENLLLCGVLLMWCAVRVRPKGLQPFFIAGVLTAGLQFVTVKAVLYTLPISLAILAFPPPGQTAVAMEVGPRLGRQRARNVRDHTPGLWSRGIVGWVCGGSEQDLAGCRRRKSLCIRGSPAPTPEPDAPAAGSPGGGATRGG